MLSLAAVLDEILSSIKAACVGNKGKGGGENLETAFGLSH